MNNQFHKIDNKPKNMKKNFATSFSQKIKIKYLLKCVNEALQKTEKKEHFIC